MTPGILLCAAAIGLLAGAVAGARWPRFWLGATLGAAAATLTAALQVLLCAAPAGSGAGWEWTGGFALAGGRAHLRLDALSALFLVLLAVVGGAGAVYSRGYWSDQEHPRSAPRGRCWWSLLVLSMGGVLVAANSLHFLLGWELFTVAAFFLITLEGRRRQVRTAGWLYLAASHVGTLCLFACFAALAARTGSWEVGPQLRELPQAEPLFWLVLAGGAVKAGVFPLHVWLPSAHANAPSHISAVLSGVAIKMGIYALVRFSGWLPLPTAAGWVVIALGACSAVAGIAFAFAQNDLKRLLAYCSVENVGVILLGLGGALLATTHGDAAWGRLLLAGALLHVWNHGLFKALLFLGAGSVLHATGTRELSRLGGLGRAMPWTATLFVIGAVAAAGLPPLNGFVGEWLLYVGLFESVAARSAVGWAAMPVALALAGAGALALASFAKAAGLAFSGAARTQAAARAHESGPWMLGPMLALAAMCAALGLGAGGLWPLLSRAVATWNPAWSAPAEAAPLGALGAANAIVAAAALVGGAALVGRVSRGAPRRGLTWDCGYAAPTAQMQYTAGSFAGIAAGWFAWLLRPVRQWQRPRHLHPAAGWRIEHLPDPVLARGLGPLAAGILAVSTAVRRLQHGRLQSYLFYLLAGLLALAGVVYFSNLP